MQAVSSISGLDDTEFRDSQDPVLQRFRRSDFLDSVIGPDSPLRWQPPWLRKSFWVSEPSTEPPPPKLKCKLPDYPEHGVYSSPNDPNARPGQEFDFITLKFSCQGGYVLEGAADSYCSEGLWQHSVPRCVSRCRLNIKSPSVEFLCQIPNSKGGSRVCRDLEPDGTIVEPKCRAPHYYSPTDLPLMRCIDGEWTSLPHCVPGLDTLNIYVHRSFGPDPVNVTVVASKGSRVYVDGVEIDVVDGTSVNVLKDLPARRKKVVVTTTEGPVPDVIYDIDFRR
ncbi:hypothetical protein JYU34_018210 [Plutella xylostella]|uniref:Sushi domain-containing protein n=1 Tax=Plutella xylostella TaxID=51655 RepID=A0ABQ7Q0A1_PLUXY|nr:hypothetical protein JYU34_018210 [Plutella xylostella]